MALPMHIAVLLTGFSLAAPSSLMGAESALKQATSPSKRAPSKTEPIKTSSSKVAQPDFKFLEYLGTLESDEENWTQIDLEQIATTTLSAAEQSALDGELKPKAEAIAKPVTERK